MSASDCSFLLADCYARARACPEYGPGVRRAFRRALRAASEGDARPTILLSYRYP